MKNQLKFTDRYLYLNARWVKVAGFGKHWLGDEAQGKLYEHEDFDTLLYGINCEERRVTIKLASIKATAARERKRLGL